MRVVILGMIYKSPGYLDFMMDQITRYCVSFGKYEVDYLIIANDATEQIKQKLVSEGIKHIVFTNQFPTEYYMNRTYKAWNHVGFNASGDLLIFINSDMAFSSDWLPNLLARYNDFTIPCSRLVESGKLSSGEFGISKDFGRSFRNYNESGFLNFAKEIEQPKVASGGLFMPFVISKEDFVKSGGYPEGNIYAGGVGAYPGAFVESGDHYFFYKNPIMKVKKHVTVFNSIVYHIQEGEKDE
jgi:hypothetical protein